MRIRLSLLAVIFIIFSALGCGKRTLYKDTQILMGTIVEVVSPQPHAAKIAFAEMRRIEDLLSKYKPDSEVSLLNRRGSLRVSPETLYLIKKSKEFWQASEGAFDITVGPVVDVWCFTQQSYRVPSEREIQRTLKSVGSDKIIFNDKNNVVKFKVSGVKVDLGAIAKGFAVDCAIKKLKEAGIDSCLINAGGDIYCLGAKFGYPWKIAIQNPRQPGFAGYLKLRNRAVATSGDYRQFFIKGSRRYAHIFNPKTGYPADTGISSVTVMAADCLTADAIATAVFVLGNKKGRGLAERFKEVKLIAIAARDK